MDEDVAGDGSFEDHQGMHDRIHEQIAARQYRHGFGFPDTVH